MASIVRILIGLGMIIGVTVSYLKHKAAIAAGSAVSVFGLPAGNSEWLIPAFIGIGAVGLVFLLVGLKGLMRRL